MAPAADLIIAGTWLYGIFIRGEAAFQNPNPMIRTKKRNPWEKEQAVAQARAEALAEAKAAANAVAPTWFEAWQRAPNSAPPPWDQNGGSPGSDRGYILDRRRQRPALKIECRDCRPVKNEAHYVNEFIINLDSALQTDPPLRKPIPAAPEANPPEKAEKAAG